MLFRIELHLRRCDDTLAVILNLGTCYRTMPSISFAFLSADPSLPLLDLNVCPSLLRRTAHLHFPRKRTLLIQSMSDLG